MSLRQARALTSGRQGRRTVAELGRSEHKRGRDAVRDAQGAAQQKKKEVRRAPEGRKPLRRGCKLGYPTRVEMAKMEISDLILSTGQKRFHDQP